MTINFEKLKSRKLIVTLIGTIIVTLNTKLALGLTDADLSNLAIIIGGYVIGQGVADKK